MSRFLSYIQDSAWNIASAVVFGHFIITSSTASAAVFVALAVKSFFESRKHTPTAEELKVQNDRLNALEEQFSATQSKLTALSIKEGIKSVR